MKSLVTHCFFALGMVLALVSPLAAAPLLIAGTWEYRQENPGMPDGLDPEGERLIIEEKQGKLIGTFFGIERAEEHGIFYFVEPVAALEMSKYKSMLRFTIEGRTLYCERPKSKIAVTKMRECGGARDELWYQGLVTETHLILQCISDSGGCPSHNAMIFKLISRDSNLPAKK